MFDRFTPASDFEQAAIIAFVVFVIILACAVPALVSARFEKVRAPVRQMPARPQLDRSKALWP